MPELGTLIARADERIEQLMPPGSRPAGLYGMMKYHLGWVDERFEPAKTDAGKRIRATLVFLCCEAVGAAPESALPAATAVELVHNFSLIHDDIQDRSDYRRHRRTVWSIWGEAQAINAGDDMLVLAQLALADAPGVATSTTVRALKALNRACQRLCEGQFLDLDFERRAAVTLDDYHAMIEHKTAALLEASCFLGALYGGAKEPALEALARFGSQLGIAFQMRDDFLGIWGDPKETGKPAASDVSSKKKTLPLLYALGEATGQDKGILEEILLRPGEADPAQIDTVLGVLERCGAAAYTASKAEQASTLAIEGLHSLGVNNSAVAELEALSRKLVVRTK